jgi:hypothetical protein
VLPYPGPSFAEPCAFNISKQQIEEDGREYIRTWDGESEAAVYPGERKDAVNGMTKTTDVTAHRSTMSFMKMRYGDADSFATANCDM